MEPVHHRDVASVHCATKMPFETNLRTTRDDKDKKTKNNVTAAHATTGDEQSNEAQQLVHYRRDGAMSVTGQLYETKLLTLFLLRLLSNKVEFYLGANISGVGALDDLCFKYKSANSEQYVVVFLQAKHKVNPDKNKLKMSDVLSNDGDFSVQKHFDSYLMIRQRFTPKSKDVIFKGTYHDSQCYFVIYTPLKHDLKMGRKPLEQNETNHNVKELLKSNSGDIFQLEYKNAEFLKEQLVEKNIRQLAKTFFAYIMKGNAKNNVIDDKLIHLYQVVLAQCVVEVIKETAEGVHYKFRSQFFDNKERLTTIFRETLYDEAVENKTFNTTDGDTSKLVSKLNNVSAESISSIIGNVVTYDQETNKLVLIDDNVNDDKNLNTFRYIEDIIVEPSIIRNAINIKGKKLLEGQEFSIPNEFGYKDLTLKGNANKIESRLNFLSENIQKILKNAIHSNGKNYVDVNERMFGPRRIARGIVEHAGGLGSALGNLLVVDNDTGALMFNARSPLPEHANTLWNKLKQEHDEHLLVTYRFKFRIDCFPKTSFQDDLYEEYLVKDFIGQYWLFTGQAKEEVVERKAKDEIIKHLKVQEGKNSVLRDKYHAVFLVLHDIIQKWWMLPVRADYLTKDTTFLQDAMSEVVNDLLLAILHRIYVNKLRSCSVEFADEAVKSLRLDETSQDLVMIITDSVTHTAVKLMQHYKHSFHYTFINFNFIKSLLFFDLTYEVTELNEKNKKIQKKNSQKDVLIITCRAKDDMESICEELAQFPQNFPDKKSVIITDEELSTTLTQELTCTYHEVRDDKNGFIDLSPSSQERILNECKVIYQGEEIVLKSIIGDDSMRLITSHILQKLVNKEVIEIGKPLATPGYNNIRHLYMERYLQRNISLKDKRSNVKTDWDDEGFPLLRTSSQVTTTRQQVRTLKDLDQNIVVVTAPPGMGKSSFLTHLSLATKKMYPNVWIARINLLDHSQQFQLWQHNKTAIDKAELMKFLCKAVTNCTCELDFDNTDDDVVILRSDSINNSDLFETKLFISLCSNGEVVFIFDGFDEICPLYEREVIQLMKATATATIASKGRKDTVKEPKLWIASRSYNNVKDVIEQEFGLSYNLKPLSAMDQRLYLEKYWTHYMKLDQFSHEQLRNITVYMKDMTQIYAEHLMKINRIEPMYFLLRRVFTTAALFIKTQMSKRVLPPLVKSLHSYWHLDTNFESFSERRLVDTGLDGSPLHTYIAAEYILSEIQQSLADSRTSKWDLDSSTFSLYKHFLETKLTKIRFAEKNCIDVSKPDSKLIHDREKADFIDTHRKLGLYALFTAKIDQIMPPDELIRAKCMIEDVKYASEKSGVIDCVVYDVPRFVHRTFAEYFAADYICEALKIAYASQQVNRLETIWSFILTTVLVRNNLGVSGFLDYKLANDDALRTSTHNDQSTRFVYEILKKQTSNKRADRQNAVDFAVRRELKATAMYLIHCLGKHLQQDDFNGFIKLVKDNKLVSFATKNEYEYCAEFVVNIVRKFDKLRMCDISI